jgi:hypothetical protein
MIGICRFVVWKKNACYARGLPSSLSINIWIDFDYHRSNDGQRGSQRGGMPQAGCGRQ